MDHAEMKMLIVEPVQYMADALAAILKTQAEMPEAKIVTTAEAACSALIEDTCNVVLISSDLPDGRALPLTQSIRQEFPDMIIMILGLDAVDALVLQYIEAGASAYVLRRESVATLKHKLRAAQRGEAIVDAEITGLVMERIAKRSAYLADNHMAPEQVALLTTREREVLELIGAGHTNREIAARLSIELGTVKNHVHNILAKLNVRSRHDAAALLTLVN